MTTRKYVWTFVLFFLLLLAAPILFFLGLTLKDQVPLLFPCLAVAAAVSLILGVLTVVLHHKDLVAYDVKRASERLETIDFTTVEASVSADALTRRLEADGYLCKRRGLYYKREDESTGDGSVTGHYYAALLKVETSLDIEGLLPFFGAGASVCNVAYIFVEDVDPVVSAQVMQYVKDTVLCEASPKGLRSLLHPKKIFAPIVITRDRVCYLKAGSPLGAYRDALRSGCRILKPYIK